MTVRAGLFCLHSKGARKIQQQAPDGWGVDELNVGEAADVDGMDWRVSIACVAGPMRFIPEADEMEEIMANITRYTPFGEIMDQMFNNFMGRPLRILEEETGMQVRTDLAEDEKAYTIKAEIPGVKKEDIHVTVDGNRVSISAETKRESEEKEGAKVIRSERYYGKVYRSMLLENDVDQSEAEAKYADGVLTLRLPKKPGSTTKQLTVN